MEDLTSENKITDRENAAILMNWKSRCNLQGQKRIFQQSLKLLSATPDKNKNFNSISTASSQEKQSVVALKTLTREDFNKSGSTSTSFEEQCSEKAGKNICSPDSSVLSKDISFVPNVSSSGLKNRTAKSFSSVPARGRGRGMLLKRHNEVANTIEPSKTRIQNSVNLDKSDNEELNQSNSIKATSMAEKILHCSENASLASELPDIVMCQNMTEKQIESGSGVCIQRPGQIVSLSESRHDKKDRNIFTLGVIDSPVNHQDCSSSDNEENTKKKTSGKPSEWPRKHFEHVSKPSSQKVKSPCKSHKGSQNKENPHKMGTKQRIQYANASVSKQSMSLQNPKSTCPFKTNRTVSLTEKGLREETILEDSDMEIAIKVNMNVTDISSVFSNVNDDLKDTKPGALFRPQREESKMGTRKQSQNLKDMLKSSSSTQESNEEVLKGSTIGEQNKPDCNVVRPSVNERVLALYNTFQTEYELKEERVFAKHKRIEAQSSSGNRDEEEATNPKVDAENVYDEMNRSKVYGVINHSKTMDRIIRAPDLEGKNCYANDSSLSSQNEVSQASTFLFDERKPMSPSKISKEVKSLGRSRKETVDFKNKNYNVNNSFSVKSETLTSLRVNQTSAFPSDWRKPINPTKIKVEEVDKFKSNKRVYNSNFDMTPRRLLSNEKDALQNCDRDFQAKQGSETIHSGMKKKETKKSRKVLQTPKDIRGRCDMVTEDYVHHSMVGEINSQPLDQEEVEDFIKEEKDLENVCKEVNHKHEKKVDGLLNTSEGKSQDMALDSDVKKLKAASYKARREKHSRKESNLQNSTESLCALKFENISIADNPNDFNDKKPCLKGEIKNAQNVILGEESKIHLFNSPEAILQRPLAESVHSSDICSKTSSDLLNSSSELGSEPGVSKGSQSESELFLPLDSQCSCQSYFDSHQSEPGACNTRPHSQKSTSPHGFTNLLDNTSYQYSKQMFSPSSIFAAPVEEFCISAYEFSEKNIQISNFLRYCSEKIKHETSSCQGYWPIGARIRVDLFYFEAQRAMEQTGFGYDAFGGSRSPCDFPHPRSMWFSPADWSEFESPHMDTSRAEARAYSQGCRLPFYSQPRSHHTRTHFPLIPGLNPGMYSSTPCNCKHSEKTKKLTHEKSQSDGKPPLILNESSVESPEDKGNYNEKDTDKMKAAPNMYGQDGKSLMGTRDSEDSNSFSPQDNAEKKTKKTSTQSFGIVNYLTKKRLENRWEKRKNFGPETERQDQPVLLKPTLKRSFSNPEVDQSNIHVAWESSADTSRKRHFKPGNEVSRSCLQDVLLKHLPEDFPYLPKRHKTIPNSTTDSAHHVATNLETGKNNGIVMEDHQPSSTPKVTFKSGANCSNWREHCLPLGTADPSLDKLFTDAPRATVYQPKRQPNCVGKIVRDAASYSKLPTTTVTGLRTRSDPGRLQGNGDFLQARREQWLQAFKHRSHTYQLSFIDTHCHIDFLYNRLGKNLSTPFHRFKMEHQEFFPCNYEGCVAVFCNPKTFAYPKPQNSVLIAVEKEDSVWLALGCHPKNAGEFEERHLHGLTLALKSPKVVALGEIGLDYSSNYGKFAEVQKRVFKVQLELALKMKLPVVVHCREADDDCLHILQSMLPKEHKIHAHCFTRGLSVAQRWIDAFPNLWLGFTPLITYKSAVDAIETAVAIPLERMLLETDAPYFVPGSLKDANVQYSYPGFALFTAERIADLRGIPVTEVLKACRKNTKDMYGI